MEKTDEELLEIIRGGESERVEFCESDKDNDKFREAICAFANDLPGSNEPGFLFIGVKDDGSIAGLSIDDELLKKLGGLRGDGKIMPFPTISVQKKSLEGQDIALIQVEPSKNTPVKLDGRCWIRSGPSRAQASADEERILTEKRKWNTLPFDAQPVQDSTVADDIDEDRFRREYLPQAVSPEVLKENNRDTEQQMRALRLIGRDNIPTAAAILVLGKDPTRWLPCAYIQFVRYAGKEVTDGVMNSREIHGTLPDQLRQAIEIIEANINVALDINGVQHVKKADYPLGALRELVANAVIHKDYQRQAPVRISWFDNRIEITNPGGLYGGMTLEDLKQGKRAEYRNPTLAETMKYMGFMERFGHGIIQVRKEIRDNGNPLPKYQVAGPHVLVIVKKGSQSQ